MIKRARLAAVLAASLAAPVACLTSDVTGPVFPSNANVYVFSVRTLPLLVYSYVDTATGANLRQSWLTDRGFAGAACIGLVPHAAVTDTFGTFIFGFNGPNYGEVQEINAGTTDTVVKSFAPLPDEGTHGNYVVDTTSGQLKLSWADGAQTQYFDPKADIRLIHDTITSHAELSAIADSIHVTWRVTWARDVCQP
jgi:hypothetical protein